jgi:hypothetical protein
MLVLVTMKQPGRPSLPSSTTYRPRTELTAPAIHYPHSGWCATCAEDDAPNTSGTSTYGQTP